MADCDDSDDAMCLEKISRSTADLGIAPLESDCDRAGPRKSQMPCSPGAISYPSARATSFPPIQSTTPTLEIHTDSPCCQCCFYFDFDFDWVLL